jgi:hypothetical protein
MSLPTPHEKTPDPDAVAEIEGELRRTLNDSAQWAVREWRRMLAAVEKKHAGYVPPAERDDVAGLLDLLRAAIATFERMGRDDPARLDHLTPADLSWHDITGEIARDEAAGRALWRKVRQTARAELAVGEMAGQAVEGYHPRPYERAAFLAVREAIADGLRPRNGMEWLLIDGMAQAWTMHLRWLGKHVKAESLDAIHVERDIRQREGWQPPRLSEAEAVDRAAQMADRAQRQFLRLYKAFRDGRRLGVSMTVLAGQVNVGEQQVNVGPGGTLPAE